MSSAYQHLGLADVRPGMVLSDVLLDQQGQVLLPQGAVLTAAIIALLPRHGVEMLAVRIGGGAPAPDEAAVLARLARVFRHCAGDNDDDWATGILHRYIEDYRLGREIEQ
jgi:hypothetical protein